MASALLSCISAARAADDDTAASTGLAEVVVTAQKRAENLQDVPISIQAIGTKKLEQMNVTNFDDYAKMLPSVSFQSGGPSFEHTLHARRGQRRRRQPLGLAAERRHVSG